MGTARTSVHWRRRARDVAGRRGRDQSRNPGRGGDGQHSWPRDAHAGTETVGPEEDTAPPRMADESHSMVSGAGTEPRAGAEFPRAPDTETAARGADAERLSVPAPHSRALPRRRRKAGAYREIGGAGWNAPPFRQPLLKLRRKLLRQRVGQRIRNRDDVCLHLRGCLGFAGRILRGELLDLAEWVRTVF